MHKKYALILFYAIGALAVSFMSALQPVVGATGSWTPYGSKNPIKSSKSNWECAKTQPIDFNVGSQVCTVRTANAQFVQGAVIVQNKNNYLYSANASVTVVINGYDKTWNCKKSGIGANSWSVCFGETVSLNNNPVYSYGYTNDQWLGSTSETIDV